MPDRLRRSIAENTCCQSNPVMAASSSIVWSPSFRSTLSKVRSTDCPLADCVVLRFMANSFFVLHGRRKQGTCQLPWRSIRRSRGPLSRDRVLGLFGYSSTAWPIEHEGQTTLAKTLGWGDLTSERAPDHHAGDQSSRGINRPGASIFYAIRCSLPDNYPQIMKLTASLTRDLWPALVILLSSTLVGHTLHRFRENSAVTFPYLQAHFDSLP